MIASSSGRLAGPHHSRPSASRAAPRCLRLIAEPSRVPALQQLRAVRYDVVGDVMSSGKVYTCQADDTIETALELLVKHGISGLPVVDTNNVVVGVVSDFDLMALDASGKSHGAPLFPRTEETWRAFKEVRTALAKGSGKKVKDVMTRTPLTVTPSTRLDDATSLLLQKRIRRLPVVDESGRLIGLLSRANIIKVALELRKATV